MKRLNKHEAVFRKNSLYDSKMCFDYGSQTFEYLPPERRQDLEPNVKYRVIADYDDYDYVDQYSAVNGMAVVVSGEEQLTKESAADLNRTLDAKRMVLMWIEHLEKQGHSSERIDALLRGAAALELRGWSVAADTSDHNHLAADAALDGGIDSWTGSDEQVAAVNAVMERFGAAAADELERRQRA
jgi:hypothetical protein